MAVGRVRQGRVLLAIYAHTPWLARNIARIGLEVPAGIDLLPPHRLLVFLVPFFPMPLYQDSLGPLAGILLDEAPRLVEGFHKLLPPRYQYRKLCVSMTYLT